MAASTELPDLAARDSVEQLSITRPITSDGVECWRLAAATGVLDLNSRYAYLLWCRDFAGTSAVARRGNELVGFVTGFRRPDAPSTLVVWQIAVDERVRGRGVAAAMLDALLREAADIDHLETTITPDNAASVALFDRFADRWEAPVHRRELFGPDLLGAGHEPEILFRIGPLRP